MKSKWKTVWQVFLSFLKIGGFTFGGGYAMIPLIQQEAVEKRHWVTDEDILDIITIAESTPGPIAINSATFVGYKAAGVWGSVFATLGVVLPSFVVILTISFVLQQFQSIRQVQYALSGIRVGVLALLVKALWSMYQKSPKGWPAYVIMAAALILTTVFDGIVIFVIIGCAVFGLATSLLMERRSK